MTYSYTGACLDVHNVAVFCSGDTFCDVLGAGALFIAYEFTEK